MKFQNLILILMIILIASSGCTVNIDLGDNSQVVGDESQSNNTGTDNDLEDELENETVIDLDDNNDLELGNESIVEENLYEDVECAALNDVQLNLSLNSQDSVSTAKPISVCSVNHDIMNGVNYKYYTFTIDSPAKIYLLIDGFENGAWQVGVIGKGFEEGSNGEAVKYHAELPAGNYIVQARPINSLGSTCTNEDCYFEFSNDETKWWIQGNEAGTAKLGFRLTLSTSEIDYDPSIEEGTSAMIQINNSCTSFSAKTIAKETLHSTAETAQSAALCDEITDTFTFSGTYQYYAITLTEETNVKITLTKPEGAWQIGVDNYGWEDSTSLGEESVIYTNTLPAGTHKVWARAVITEGNSGYDWACQEVIINGTCYWKTGVPPTGVYYLNYKVSFDSE